MMFRLLIRSILVALSSRPSDLFHFLRVSPIASAVNSFSTDAEGDLSIENGGSLDSICFLRLNLS